MIKFYRECINRVCEAAGLRSVDKVRYVDRKIVKHIASFPRMDHTGCSVSLTISSSSLTLVSLETGQRIATHDMPRISFASGGDTDTLDFVAYVAKDLNDWRACYVVECGGGLAQDVISTIGQAFELRFKQHQNKPNSLNTVLGLSMVIGTSNRDPDRDYYNDLPGKVPPDVGPPPVPPLPSIVHSLNTLPNVNTTTNGASSNTNLIDLNTEAPTLPSVTHDYVNDDAQIQSSRDVFDMRMYKLYFVM